MATGTLDPRHDVHVDALALACQVCPLQSPSDYWLIAHLVLSFVLVAYVRWSRVVIHTHACNKYQLPTCCRQQKAKIVGIEKANDKDLMDAKEDTVLPPTLTSTNLHMYHVQLPRRVSDKDLKDCNECCALQKGKKPTAIEIPDDIHVEHMQRIATFQRMIKVGVPKHLVEMKAMKEGVTLAELTTEATNLDPSVPATIVPATIVPATIVPYSRRSSISSTVSTAPSTPDALATPSFFSTTVAKMAPKTGTRKKVHWCTTMYPDTKSVVPHRPSLWHHIHAKDPLDRMDLSSQSRQWMEKLFVKANPTANGSASSDKLDNPSVSNQDCTTLDHVFKCVDPVAKSFQRKHFVMFLNVKKSQNIAIVLARVNRTFPELFREILALNCSVLSSTALKALIDMWPDSAEQEAINHFCGNVHTLATAERFLYSVRKIPRAQQKLRCLQFKIDFQPRVEQLCTDVNVLCHGLEQVCTSACFAGVMEYIFHVGNLLNFGPGVEYMDWIKSFSVRSLGQLSITKAYDGHKTLLQYVVQSIERDEPRLALFSKELSLIPKCTKLSFPSLLAEYHSLQAGLQLLLHETQTAAGDTTEDVDLGSALENARETMRGFGSEVARELKTVQARVKALEREKSHFFAYFEEDKSVPIEDLVGSIATFTMEYSRERQRLVAQTQRQQGARGWGTSRDELPRMRHSM